LNPPPPQQNSWVRHWLHAYVTPELGAVLSDQFETPAALHPGKEIFVRIEQEFG